MGAKNSKGAGTRDAPAATPSPADGAVQAAFTPKDALWDSSWVEGPGERTIALQQGTEGADVTLFAAWFCPYAQRAWITLEEKNISYQWVEINPYEVHPSKPGGYSKAPLSKDKRRELYPAFMEASPRGETPAIACNGGTVWDSLFVVEYLDTAFPGESRLIPGDDEPLLRSYVRIWTAHTGRMQSAFKAMLSAQDTAKADAARQRLFTETKAMARAMSPLGEQGPYFLGHRFSLVDVALAPLWQRWLVVGGHYRGFVFPADVPEFARLTAWWEAVSTRPSVAKTIVCAPRLAAAYLDTAMGLQK